MLLDLSCHLRVLMWYCNAIVMYKITQCTSCVVALLNMNSQVHQHRRVLLLAHETWCQKWLSC